ncbi:TolC family protein [Pyxidicoccus fallax]|uniref:TolC family protein n=1 Tax=Pyxidicoccus fallax TaxID=394095 RepID=A0A848LXR7_9BACT|nr:TolC family protein [Pyxidicoccus fallax]NMO22401.1 TolC family protein [Pyxidicoccus fallax]NPC84274.1 TolC family protein [Pyxidicoccus fallax]
MNALIVSALLAAAPAAAQDSAPAATQPATPAPAPAATPATAPAVAPEATSPITLDEVRSLGRRNTNALQALLDVETAEADVGVSRSALLPQLSFNASAGKLWQGRRRAVVTVPNPTAPGTFVTQEVETPSNDFEQYDLGLSLSQILYDRARFKQLEQSGVLRDAEKSQAVEEADTSELEAIRRFFALFRTQASLQVLEATVKRSEEQLERARALFQAGRVGKNEEITALVNLGNDRITFTETLAQLVTDQTNLAIWLARPGTEPLLAVDPGVLTQEPAPAPGMDIALAQARERRPLLQALQLQVRSAELQRAIARADYIPRLAAQGSYSRQGPDAEDVFTEPRLQNNFTAGVNLTWNLFNGFATGAQTRRAEAAIRRAQLVLEQSAREIEANVRQAHRSLLAQLEAARLAADNREAAVQGLRLAEERFRAGAGSTLEVRDAQLSLTRAELSLLENRIDVEIARFTLMRAMGALSPGETK